MNSSQTYPFKQGVLYLLHRKKLSLRLYESWNDRYFFLNGTNLVYFLEGIDEKPRKRIPLVNAVIEGIFFRDELFVVTIRCSKEHDSFYTLGHSNEHELKDWFDQLKRAIDLATNQDSQTRRGRTSSVMEQGKVEEKKEEVEELAKPMQEELRKKYEEVMKWVDAADAMEWKTVCLKNNSIIRHLPSDPPLFQLSMTFRNTPLPLLYNSLLTTEDYPTWNSHISHSRSILKITPNTDLVTIQFTSKWWDFRDDRCLLTRHYAITSKSAVIIAHNVTSPLYPSSVNVELMAFYIRHREEMTYLQGFFRGSKPKNVALSLAKSFSMLSHSVVLAPITRDEQLPEDVDGLLQRLSHTPNPVGAIQLVVRNLDTGKEFVMSYEGMEEEEKRIIMHTVRAE